jgi:hypothetical protein
VAQEAFEKLLGYSKNTSMVALLPIGVPDENPSARNRKPLEEIMKLVL